MSSPFLLFLVINECFLFEGLRNKYLVVLGSRASWSERNLQDDTLPIKKAITFLL